MRPGQRLSPLARPCILVMTTSGRFRVRGSTTRPRVGRGLLNEDFARNLLSWKHSGFSIDNSIRILDESAQESLAEYIARPPISLKKIRYEPFKGMVLFHTKYSDYFKENVHMLDALDFLAELTQHIPPKGLQLIRRYGLYASRTKGRWHEMRWVTERAPEGWRAAHQ